MSGETPVNITGNLVADPEITFTPSGQAVANLTIASTPRTFDRNSNQWVDADTLFLRCSIWREPAQNVVDSLKKGMRVIAQGRLKQRSYTTKDGSERTVIECELEEIGPSLRYATAVVTRTQNTNGQQGQPQQGGNQWNGGQAPQQPAQGGQWGNQPPQQGQWGQYGQPQPAQQPQTAPAQQYAQSAANGPQQGAQQWGNQPPAQDPWAQQQGQDNTPPF